jgi:integrase
MELLDRLVATMPADQPYIVGVNDSTRDTLWRKARDRSGVEDLTFHDLKHEACTRLSKFIDVIALSHAVGTKDVRLLRDTYYNNDAERNAALLPAQLSLKIEDQDAEDSAALLP